MSTSSASGSTATVAVDVWMRPLASVAGTRWTRCTPLSYFSRLYTPRPSIDSDHFLQAADAGVAARHHLEAPALALGEPAVHAEQIAGEQRRLVAASAGADFEHDVLLVVRILRNEQQLELGVAGVAPRAQALQLFLRELAQVGIAAACELLGLLDLIVDAACTRGTSRRAARSRRAPSRACGIRPDRPARRTRRAVTISSCVFPFDGLQLVAASD